MKHKIITTLILIVLLIIATAQVIFYEEPEPEQFVDTIYGTLAYKTYGEGEKPLIAVHGSPGGKENFDNLGPLLTEYTVYAIDMPGFGESTMRAKDYGFSQGSKVLFEFMNELNIDKAEILGYSWGGGVVSTFASEYPEKVNRLILLAAVGVPESAHTQNYFTEQLRSYISYPAVIIYPGAFAPEMLNLQRRHGFIRSFMDSDQRLQYDIMKNINVPTHIIQGDKDTVVLMSGAIIHQELIKESTLYVYEGGHGEIFGDSTELAKGVRS